MYLRSEFVNYIWISTIRTPVGCSLFKAKEIQVAGLETNVWHTNLPVECGNCKR